MAFSCTKILTLGYLNFDGQRKEIKTQQQTKAKQKYHYPPKQIRNICQAFNILFLTLVGNEF